MLRLPYLLADVFTDTAFGGNPLAVFTDREANAQLTDSQMQVIAGELNLSESVFVLPPEKAQHTCRVRIFTPASELPFAGHPTVGTAFVLHHLGQAPGASVTLEQGIGPVEVRLTVQQNVLQKAELRNTTPAEFRHGLAPDVACRILGLPLGQVKQVHAAAVGVPFHLVELHKVDDLARIQLDLGLFRSSLHGAWATMVFVYTATGADSFQARMFAPLINILEDPATGAATAAFAAWLGQNKPDGEHRWTIHQGIEMGRPSRLEAVAEVQGRQLTAVRVGGSAVLIGEGQLWLA